MDELHQHIDDLVAEEHRLRGGSVDDAGRTRLAELERQLDQAWDLLRRRNAAREAGTSDEPAGERSQQEVENYLQ